MRLPKAKLAYVVLCLGVATMMGAPAFAQQNDSTRVGLPHDWSHHHVIFTDNAPPDIVAHPELAKQLRNDPRFLAYVIKSNARRQVALARRDDHEKSKRHKHKPKIDWSISLGSGSTPLNQYPAKYAFDVTATPDCVNDYVVFPINVADSGTLTQPNIVGFHYLYSGASGGLCNATTPATNSAAVYFSYIVNAIGGAVLTSPVISLDGKKIAFVESKSGTAPHFHVLAFKAGDGFISGSPTSVASPVAITSFAPGQPTAGQATDLSYSSSCITGNGNSNSSPFVDYTNDVAWVGDDCGNLIKLRNIFTTTAPNADPAFNGGAPYAVCSGHKTTGPVYDSTSGDVFMGCDDGNVYQVVPGSTPTLAHQNGGGSSTNLTNQGGVSDSPLVDSGNGFVYWTHPDDGVEAYVAQVKSTTNFGTATVIKVPIGPNNVAPVHAPTFNNPYFVSDVGDWALFACGFTSPVPGPANRPELYSITFSIAPKSITSATGDISGMGTTAGAQCSPLTDFLGGDGTDRIFFGITSGVVNMFQVGTSTVNNFDGSQTATSANEGGGTSGIIVDNNSASANASSIYFSTLTGHTAVKLTQSALQ